MYVVVCKYNLIIQLSSSFILEDLCPYVIPNYIWKRGFSLMLSETKTKFLEFKPVKTDL